MLTLAWLALAACGRDGPRAVPAGPRVVSLSPSTTEAMFAIGAGAAIVGRSRHCDFPAEAAGLPAVGGFADPSIESILALSPTLVVGARGPAGPALQEALNAHGIATYFPETESIAQIEAMIEGLGARLGAEAGAARAVGGIRARARAVEGAVGSKSRVRAAFLFDTSPVFVAGPGSFPDELLRRAGGENVIKVGGAYPTVGVEQLLALDPDVLLDGAGDATPAGGPSRVAALRDAPGWSALRALRQGRVRVIDGAVVLRPGPRIGEGLVAVARALHGDGLALADAAPPSAP